MTIVDVHESEDEAGQSAGNGNGNGNGNGRKYEDIEREDAAAFYRSICPITDKDEMPFRLMELPTEIRLVRGELDETSRFTWLTLSHRKSTEHV